MPKFAFQLDVRDLPAKVIGAMVDFAQRRPEIWPNLTAHLYQLHELGSGTVEVTEGTAFGGIDVWERVTHRSTASRADVRRAISGWYQEHPDRTAGQR